MVYICEGSNAMGGGSMSSRTMLSIPSARLSANGLTVTVAERRPAGMITQVVMLW